MKRTPDRLGGGKLRDHPEVVAAWAGDPGPGPGPLVVEVTVTGGCNHNCVHCGSQQFRPYSEIKTFIERQAFQRFLLDFRAMGGIEVFFAGWGEPLVNPEIEKLVAFSGELGLSNVMSSNGVALTEAKACAILPHLNWIRFSVNGGDADTYAGVHHCAPADYEKLERNLKAADRVRREEGLDVRLLLQFIVLDDNYQTIKQAVDFHKAVGSDQIVFRNAGDRERSRPEPWLEIKESLDEVDNGGDVIVRWETFEQNGNAAPWRRCHGINFRINMESSGQLVTCSKHLIENSAYGNILFKRFPDIWKSKRRAEVFARVESGEGISECSRFCQVAADNLFLDGERGK